MNREKIWACTVRPAERYFVVMEARLLKDSDGRERVLVELAEFQALLDAARSSEVGLPEVGPLVRKLAALLDEPRKYVDLNEFLTNYDAAHGESS